MEFNNHISFQIYNIILHFLAPSPEKKIVDICVCVCERSVFIKNFNKR